jgi:threonine synthase
MWRYREALPLSAATEPVSCDEGFTPLLKYDMHGRTVHLKQEHLFQTGSYKDRGAAVLITKARELGVREVVEDSSGNAGCAIAAYCAAAQIACHIYVPEATSAAKLAQIQAYGAILHKIPGSRDDVAQAALAAAQNTYYASHVWNPFFLQGTKTVAYEICEQLDWQAPDAVVLPAGNGTLLLGAWLGFGELHEAGHIQAPPRLIAVQAANCAPLAQAYIDRTDETPILQTSHTLAEGIAISHPVRGKQILAAVRKSHGHFITVTEDQISAAFRQIARRGFYIEPTSAATIAGLREYLDTATPQEIIVSVLTGHGLKSTEKILNHLL